MLTNQDRVQSVQQTLRILFGVVPIVAGADKFFNLLTNWEQYVNPMLARMLPFSTTTFMHIVGVIEIAAGAIVLSRFTTYGAYLVSAWLALIAISLLASGHYLDVAVRDLVMSASAYSLATLSRVHQDQRDANYNPAPAHRMTA
jgi:uncharacterized membrane protein YphA (DoxX/SURF4 family)